MLPKTTLLLLCWAACGLQTVVAQEETSPIPPLDANDTVSTRGFFGPGIGLGPGFAGPGFAGPGFGGSPGFGGQGFRPGFHGGVGFNQFGSGGFAVQAPQAHCRFWCRTPHGQAYCCEGADQPQTPVFDKPGLCPPIRPTCNLRFFGPPSPCSNDGACSGIDKCCFDTCLEQHVCKPPHGVGR